MGRAQIVCTDDDWTQVELDPADFQHAFALVSDASLPKSPRTPVDENERAVPGGANVGCPAVSQSDSQSSRAPICEKSCPDHLNHEGKPKRCERRGETDRDFVQEGPRRRRYYCKYTDDLMPHQHKLCTRCNVKYNASGNTCRSGHCYTAFLNRTRRLAPTTTPPPGSSQDETVASI